MCLRKDKMWENSKKYIFYNIFKNATKYLKIVLKDRNQTIENILFFRKIFSPTKHRQSFVRASTAAVA